MAFYPLNSRYNGRDISKSRNPPGRFGNTRPGVGPDGTPGGSIRFKGRTDSYIEFPNKGRLTARNSITLLAWVFPAGPVGPIFNYKTDGFGVHFWLTRPRELFARFVSKKGSFTTPIKSNKIRLRAWNFVGTTYNHRSGIAKLYINNKLVASRRIGRITLLTNYPARMGAKTGDNRAFRGRITCMQVYGVALNVRQMKLAKERCFKTSKSNITFDFTKWFSCDTIIDCT